MAMTISQLLTYILQKAAATLIRTLIYLRQGPPVSNPDEKLFIPSRERGRSIKLHIYNSKSDSISKSTKPSPVLINAHGSGFIIPLHGSDDLFCQRVCQNSEFTVVDFAYRLAPEHPFPAAVQDFEDVLAWVRQQSRFEAERTVLSGFSAGGMLALATASSDSIAATTASSASKTFKPLKGVVAVYPVTDISVDPTTKKAPDLSGRIIPPWLAKCFNACYLGTDGDGKNPRVSPSLADPATFPTKLLVVTAAGDTLCVEAEKLAQRIAEVDGSRERKVVVRRFEGVNHGWDKRAANDVETRARDEAYALAVDMLREC